MIATGVACIVAAVALSACGQGHTGFAPTRPNCTIAGHPCPTVPHGLAGNRLSDVEAELSRDPIQFTIAGGGGFSFVARNWGVCSTVPSAGQPIDTVLILYISHFACGAKRGFAGSQRVPSDLVGKHPIDVGDELSADNIEVTAHGVDEATAHGVDLNACQMNGESARRHLRRGSPSMVSSSCTSATSPAVGGSPQRVSHPAVHLTQASRGRGVAELWFSRH